MKNTKTVSIFSFALMTALFVLGSLRCYAQPTHQDCLDAIPICGTTYTSNVTYNGVGNYNNEINAANTCAPTHSENNSVWFVITNQSAGAFGFLLTPTDPTANYDWEVYDITGTTCAAIRTNPALKIDCNHDATPGPTGMCGGVGPQYSASLATLTANREILIVVDFMSGAFQGFTLDFSCSTTSLINNVPPHLSSVTIPPCNADSVRFYFDEDVTCASMNAANFYLVDNETNAIITVTSISSTNCINGAPYSNYFTLHLSTPLTNSGQYTIHITGGATDLCGNVAASGSLPFNIAGTTIQARHAPAGCSCNGRDSIHILTGLSPYTYSWTQSQTSNVISTASLITGLCAGYIYTCTVHGNTGCPGIVIDTIPSGSNFSITTASVNSGCSTSIGQASVDSINNGTGPYLFNWSPGGGSTDTITNLAAGSYAVTVTDQSSGCTATGIVVVGAGGNLSITASSTNASCSSATNGTAWVTVTDTNAWNPTWSNGNDSAHIHNLAAGTYTVTVTDAVTGCSATATVTVSATAGMQLSTTNSTVPCATAHNGSVSVTVTSGGQSPFTYLWSNNETTPTDVNLGSGTFRVTVTDSLGCSGIDSATITIADTLNLTFALTYNPTCIDPFFSYIYIYPSGGNNTYQYHWSNGNASQYFYPPSAGTYTVTVTDIASGCTDSRTFTLTTTNTVVVTMDSSNVLCHGDSSGSAWATIAGGIGPYTYAWTPTGGNSDTASHLAPGNYTLIVYETASPGCADTGIVSITQPPALTIAMLSYTSSCNQHNGSLVAQPGGGTTPYSYHWGTNPVQTTDSASHLALGTYVCTVTDANGCTIVDSATVGMVNGQTSTITSFTNALCFDGSSGTATVTAVGGTSPYTYNWNSTPNQSTQTANSLPAGTYTVTVYDATGCTSTDTVAITQPTTVTLTVGGSTTECVGQPAIINAHAHGGLGLYTYLWSNSNSDSVQTVNPIVTTTYYCTATDVNGCTSPSESITVTVLPGITVTAYGPPDTICAGKTVKLTATATGGNNGPYTYTWSPGGSVGNIVSVSPSVTTTYTCSADDGCSLIPGTTVVIVYVVPVPLVNFSMSVISGCDPLTINFSNLSLDVSSGSTYNWNFGGLGVDTAKDPTFIFNQSGLFNIKLVVTSPEGCTATMIDSDGVNVLPKPTAIISAEPTIATKSTGFISFYNNSVGGDYWDWMFNDAKNSTSSLKDPSFTYTDTGSFRPELVTMNLFGCTDTAYIDIYIKDDFTFYIPSAFTPNNDGHNETFGPVGINVQDYTMYIFDRYGNQIFMTTDMSVPWDGTDSSGKLVPENVYVYWIQNSDLDGNKHQYTGRVTILR